MRSKNYTAKKDKESTSHAEKTFVTIDGVTFQVTFIPSWIQEVAGSGYEYLPEKVKIIVNLYVASICWLTRRIIKFD